MLGRRLQFSFCFKLGFGAKDQLIWTCSKPKENFIWIPSKLESVAEQKLL